MRKDLRTISFTSVLFIAFLFLSACRETTNGPGTPPPPKTKGLVAIVYSDLTKSINEDTAVRQKQNIGELFQKLPVNTKFFLSSIDRGSNTPTIYKFTPEFPKVKVFRDKVELEKKESETKEAKQTTEFEKLNSSLNSYHTRITKQQGSVSCISNKLNSLLDTIWNKKKSFPDHEIRVFFYSDMIEECGNSFDGKPLTFKRAATDREEAKHLQDVQTRIEQNFQPADRDKNLKSLGTKIYIVLTSQDDKQSLKTLKTIWNAFFVKLGLDPDDLVWANGNDPFLWRID